MPAIIFQLSCSCEKRCRTKVNVLEGNVCRYDFASGSGCRSGRIRNTRRLTNSRRMPYRPSLPSPKSFEPEVRKRHVRTLPGVRRLLVVERVDFEELVESGALRRCKPIFASRSFNEGLGHLARLLDEQDGFKLVSDTDGTGRILIDAE